MEETNRSLILSFYTILLCHTWYQTILKIIYIYIKCNFYKKKREKKKEQNDTVLKCRESEGNIPPFTCN